MAAHSMNAVQESLVLNPDSKKRMAKVEDPHVRKAKKWENAAENSSGVPVRSLVGS